MIIQATSRTLLIFQLFLRAVYVVVWYTLNSSQIEFPLVSVRTYFMLMDRNN